MIEPEKHFSFLELFSQYPYFHVHHLQTVNISPGFSITSEAFASEVIESHGEMCLHKSIIVISVTGLYIQAHYVVEREFMFSRPTL